MKRKCLAVSIVLLFVGTCNVHIIRGEVKNQDLWSAPLINTDMTHLTQNSICRSSYDSVHCYSVNEQSNGEPLFWWKFWRDFPGRYEPFFEVHDIIDFGQTAWGLTSADFNKDDKLDFAVCWATSPWTQATISLFYHDGDGSFTQDDVYTITQPDATYFQSLNSGDYDNDDDIDLLYTYNEYIPWHYTNGTVHILFNDGDNHFGNPTLVARHEPIGGKKRINPKLASADYDSDGDVDFLVGDNSGFVELYKNNGTGHFVSAGLYNFNGSMSWGLASADFDNDEDIDFIVTQEKALQEGCIYLVRNDGSDDCFNQSDIVKIVDLPPQPSFFAGIIHGFGCVCSLDYNGDGLMDFVFSGGNSAFLYMQHETGLFDYVQLMTLPSPKAEDGGYYNDDLRGGGITSGDFDKDGLPDLLIGGVQGVARICYNKCVLVDIIRPDGANLFIGNGLIWQYGLVNPIMIYFFIQRGTSLVIGDFTVEAKGLVPLQKVEFYLGNRLVYTDETTPYEWNWTSFSFGRYKIKAVAYDLDGKKVGYDDAIVWKYL